MFFYFKRIHVYNVENIPKDKPVLLLANHQNALLDALLIATKCGRFSYFLTRAAVFKKSFVSRILKSLQMLPVYRVRDGWSTITNNNAIFESCSELLKNKEVIVIFPEGSHNIVRRVRPLSKGFTRIVFDSLEKYPDLDLQLVPVGLNFVKAEHCPDSTAIYFGKPLSAKDYLNENKNKAVVNLKAVAHSKMKELTTHIPEENYKKNINKLEVFNVDYLKPKEVNACIESNFTNCRSKKSQNQLLGKTLRLLLKLNLIIPFVIWRYWVKPKIKEIEFVSTFRFALAVTLVPFWLLSVVAVITVFFSFCIALYYLTLSLLLALLAIKL
ncbi:glycerol acyltransferase [Pontimicrobium aquaticum]|uniref:Glycerol acyltransferase n=2 Tax=Pontimicrobium aquaticum TaxID=2565367 RepID=A0A4U0EMZ1_9FLAO|nr:glycerol acyltransferase [Pontimicrobium aquaticum]